MNITMPTNNRTAYCNYVLHLADANLILSQRLCEWCGHGPVLEQDIALSNIALDLMGATRSLYQYAAQLQNENKTEDDLAFLRGERDFRNFLICELPNGDFGFTVVRQFLYAAYQLQLLEALQKSSDAHLSAIAEKSHKEALYHYKWSAEWVIRLGDGTEESKQRIQQSVDDIWTYTGEMFKPADWELELIEAGSIPDCRSFAAAWQEKVAEVFGEATLTIPPADTYMQKGGKNGLHTEHLGFLLAEMQYMQRQYPGLEW